MRLPPFEGEELRCPSVLLVLLRAGLPPLPRPLRPFPFEGFPAELRVDDFVAALDAEADDADLDLDPVGDLASALTLPFLPRTGIACPIIFGGFSSRSSVQGGDASHLFRVSFEGFSL